ncbi:MAG: hypothetical protein ACOCUU_03245 [Nanoarchaeota archaeon]
MNKKEIISKVKEKKEFSQITDKDIEKVYLLFEKRQTSDEEKIKLIRKTLHETFTSTLSQKLLNSNIVNKKSPEEILKKHISTKERFDYYEEFYSRILMNFENQRVCIFDLGAGINGLSFKYLREINSKISYIGIETVNQLVELINYYFKNKGFENARVINESLFNLDKIIRYIKNPKENKIIFLFKVIDSLERIERNYSKKLIRKIFSCLNKNDKVIVSFAISSLVKNKKFKVKRYWFENFLKQEKIQIVEDFILGNERYLVLKR